MGGDDEHLGAILDAIPASVAYVDRDLCCRVANAAFRDWFGDVRGKHVREVLGPSRYEEVRELFERALRGERVTGELETLLPDGVRRWVKGEYVPDFDEARHVRGVSVHLVDITEAKRALQRKDDFLAIVGHELRDPLAPIVTALDVMEYSGLVGCERERAVIRRQALHMSRLVDDLLDVARIRRGMLGLQKRPVELHTIIARAVELASPLFEQRHHHLTVGVPRELVVDGDATRLTQVFSNLLTNAAKYTDPRGHISITGARCGDEIAVTVSDDGSGIAQDRLADIFEPFVQGDHVLQRAHGGLGLGLSLVRSLTELHGGSVRVESEGPGRGARFTVRLPAYRIAIAPHTNGTCRTVSALPGARLLVVDDNADAARVLAELLREHGYNVAVAHDAPGALVLADQFQPAIALLDIGLPVMDGYELARHLRTRLAKPPRLVAVTGYGDQADPGRNADAGFDVHLGKPVDFDKLVSVLGSLSPS